VLAQQIKRLVSQSLIYGLGGLISRFLSLLLLPLYTSYLHGRDYGRVETLTALTAVLVVVLRLGISSAFFRYYFDSTDWEHRVRVVRTSFWFTMGSATFGLAAGWIAAQPIADVLSLGHGQAWLVRAAFVGLWAQMNYEQLTSLFRVEERPVLRWALSSATGSARSACTSSSSATAAISWGCSSTVGSSGR